MTKINRFPRNIAVYLGGRNFMFQSPWWTPRILETLKFVPDSLKENVIKVTVWYVSDTPLSRNRDLNRREQKQAGSEKFKCKERVFLQVKGNWGLLKSSFYRGGGYTIHVSNRHELRFLFLSCLLEHLACTPSLFTLNNQFIRKGIFTLLDQECLN